MREYRDINDICVQSLQIHCSRLSGYVLVSRFGHVTIIIIKHQIYLACEIDKTSFCVFFYLCR